MKLVILILALATIAYAMPTEQEADLQELLRELASHESYSDESDDRGLASDESEDADERRNAELEQLIAKNQWFKSTAKLVGKSLWGSVKREAPNLCKDFLKEVLNMAGK